MATVHLLALTCALAGPTRTLATPGRIRSPSFASFIAEYGREYPEQEYEMRRDIYEHQLKQVHRHNNNPHRRWSAGINHLSDRTEVELAQLRGLRAVKNDKSSKLPGMVRPHKGQFLEQIKAKTLPDEKSWLHLHAISAPSNQEGCGSCWAVATSTVLQANAEINGYNRTFSSQELVSCAPNPHHCGGTGGCAGSTVELAMNWVMEKGLDTLDETPYKGVDSKCKKHVSLIEFDENHYDKALKDMIAIGYHGAKSKSSAGTALGLRGWERLDENTYEPLLRAVAETGPVGVSVSAAGWTSYDNGVFDSCKKDAVIDHAVTLVGYGREKATNDKYWIIKNSWGPSWGEKGNVRLLRHEGNDDYCGTDRQPEVGTGCTGGPSEVHVCGMCGILYDSVVPYFHKRR